MIEVCCCAIVLCSLPSQIGSCQDYSARTGPGEAGSFIGLHVNPSAWYSLARHVTGLMKVNTKAVNIREAWAHFSKLLATVPKGERITICKTGTPVAELGPLDTPIPVRRPGLLKDMW